MAKAVYIAEKPSVAKEFAKALKESFKSNDGYLESDNSIVTWCVGHLVNMCYPEEYDAALKKWSFDTIPFIPESYKYQVISSVSKQFNTVKKLLTRDDVERIYVCTDSGREGEYIYRLVDQEAHVTGKDRRRVWIDSQTEEEILRGIREAKDLSEYDNLSSAAYLRAKEDYLMGINFSRALTLKYGYGMKNFLKADKCVISVGRVMTCVLGMVVTREREIRDFVKTPFYRVLASLDFNGTFYDGEFRAVEGSKYFESPVLYKENGFKKEEDAQKLIEEVKAGEGNDFNVFSIEKKKEKRNPLLLYNLADLQNDCSKYFKINPDQTLKYVQELYEKKLVTYPRTDARVLSSAVAKEIHKNLGGLKVHPLYADIIQGIFSSGSYKKIGSTKYTNDKLITDHYAIIPTGQGFDNLKSVDKTCLHIYEIICRRFLGIFLPPAVYEKVSLVTERNGEKFFSSFKVLKEEGFLAATTFSFIKKKEENADSKDKNSDEAPENINEEDKTDKKSEENEDVKCSEETLEFLSKLKKGDKIPYKDITVKEGETSPPKRYNSGSMILAMESAGNVIEDEELRAQLKGSGIGTSATRAGILTKLFNNGYLKLNKKTQIITPTLLGEMINDAVYLSIPSLLYPKLTASWEKGLNMVANGEVGDKEYMDKLTKYVSDYTNDVKNKDYSDRLNVRYKYIAQFYRK